MFDLIIELILLQTYMSLNCDMTTLSWQMGGLQLLKHLELDSIKTARNYHQTNCNSDQIKRTVINPYLSNLGTGMVVLRTGSRDGFVRIVLLSWSW